MSWPLWLLVGLAAWLLLAILVGLVVGPVLFALARSCPSPDEVELWLHSFPREKREPR